MVDHARRSHVIGLTVRQRSWDLESLRERNQIATDALVTADAAVKAVELEINEAESALYRAMRGDISFDVTAMQSVREYLMEQYEKRNQCQSEQKCATQHAEKIEQQLKHLSLTIKALQQVKENADSALTRKQEHRELERSMELWMQRSKQED